MAIPIKCAGCQAAFDVPDNLAGKTIRCTSCKTQLTVASAAPAAAPAAKTTPVAKPAKKIEVDDQDDVKTKPGKAKDAKETKAKSAAARRRDEDDDDEDDDDRPRKKGKGKAAAKGGGGMVALIAIGGIGICAIIGVSIFLLMGSGSDDKKSANSGSPSAPTPGTPPGGSQGPAPGGAAAGGASSNWVNVQGDGFTCQMPSEPKSMNQEGQKLQLLERNNGTEAFCASVVDLGAGAEAITSNANQRGALFNKMSEGAVQGMNQMGGGVSFRITGSRDTTQDGLPGRDVTLSATGRANASGTMKMIAGRSKVYLFFWIGSGGTSDSQTFFASVKIAEGSGGVAMGGPNAPGAGPGAPGVGSLPAPGGGSSLGPTPGAGPGAPGVGSLPNPGAGPGAPGVGSLPTPGGGSSLGPVPGAGPGTPGIGSLPNPNPGAGPGTPGIGSLPNPGGGSSLGPPPGMNPGGAGAGATPPPPAPPGLPGGGLGPVPGGPGPGSLGPVPGGPGPGSLGPVPGGPGPGSLGPTPGGPGGGPGGIGQSGGGGQDRPPAGAAVRPPLAHKLYAFYAVAFDAESGDFYTVTWRVDPKNQARTLGELRRHGADFKEKAVFNIPNLATRAVIDPKRGLLFAAAATNQGEMRTLYSLGYDRANAYGDVQVYDLKPIQDGKVADGADLKPVGSINLNASIRGLELSNDGKHLLVAVNKAVPGGQPKTYIRQYEASDRKFIKEVSLGEQALDVRKNADGNLLVGFEYDSAGRKPSVAILTCDPVSLEVKKLRSPGVVTDYSTRANGSSMFAIIGQADRNGARPGQLHAADPAGDVNMLGTTAWKASNNNYARFSADGSHLFVTSFANRDARTGNLQNAGLDVYVPDTKDASGYKKIASIRDAIRVTSSVPVGGYFDVTPDGSHVLFHTGAVLAVKNIATNAEGADKVPEPGGNSGGGGPGAGPGGLGVPGAGPGGVAPGGLGIPGGPGGVAPGGLGIPGGPGGVAPGGLGIPGGPGGVAPGGLGIPPMAGGAGGLPIPGGVPPMAGGAGGLPIPGGVPPMAGGAGGLPIPGGGAPIPGGGAPPAAPPMPPGK